MSLAKAAWTPDSLERMRRPALAAILALALILRLAVRLAQGPAAFWRGGYGFFYAMAVSVASGHGLTMGPHDWAARQPIYPLFLALTVPMGRNYLLIVLPQALMGTLSVGCVFLIGRRLFGTGVGLLAALMAAVYPYYVAHDTALQDTCIATLAASVALLLALRAQTAASPRSWLAAGAALGLAVLTRATLAPFALGAVVWIGLVGEGPPGRRFVRAAAMAGACALAIAPWLIRNDLVVGRPVLSSEVGRNFWIAHDADTFRAYPRQSIDRSRALAFGDLSAADRRALAALPGEVARSDWFMARGLAYVRAHPWRTAVGAVRKEAAGFSWTLNPERSGLVQDLYFASYAPILVLGLLGMAATWRRWREQGLVYVQFLGFIAVTAVYWAHTSHRVYLDVYLMVYAAFVLERVAAWAGSRSRPGGAARPPVPARSQASAASPVDANRS